MTFVKLIIFSTHKRTPNSSVYQKDSQSVPSSFKDERFYLTRMKNSSDLETLLKQGSVCVYSTSTGALDWG